MMWLLREDYYITPEATISTGMVFDGSGEVQPGIEEYFDSSVVFYEDMDDCWQTEESWGGFMIESFNWGEKDITSDENSLLFEWLSLLLNHRLSRGVVSCLPWFFPVPLFCLLPIPFGHGMMNAIWVCGGLVWMLFYLLIDKKKVRGNFFARQLQSCFSFSTRNKIDYAFLSQYNTH